MRLILTVCLFSILTSMSIIAQTNYVHDEVMKASKSNELRESIDLNFSPETALKTNQKQKVIEATFAFDEMSLKKIIKSQKEFIQFSITNLEGEQVPLSLVKAEIFASGFKVMIDGPNNRTQHEYEINESAFYRGIVDGDEKSLVALSMHDGSLTGFINSQDYGDLGFRKSDSGSNVMYDLHALSHESLECGTQDDGVGYSPKMLEAPSREKAAGDYVSIFIEVEFDVVEWQGGVSQATTYITDLFNESAAIYAGDGVDTRISEIEINSALEYGRTRGRRFTKHSGSSQYLSQFQSDQSNFNGDLAQLVVFNNVGGVAAGFSGLCNADTRQSMCMSGFVTDYFFNLQIFAHELGHLFGSRHTHACVWNGDNTAIDGCSGSTEGTCALPPPAGQNEGTIMSYCYNNYGLDFNEGFHPQPSAVIQNNVILATCLNSGTGGNSCFDGIQNGDETGVDCGGSCVACPTCNDGVQNGDETGVDCGGSCQTTCPPVSCDDPTALAVRNMRNKKGTGSAQLDWADVSDATSYDMRIRVSGTTSWTGFNTAESNISLEGFSDNTEYEWEVRANCSSGSSSYVGCSFTYVNRGDNVNCGTVSPGAGYVPFGENELVNISPNPVSAFLLIEIENPQKEIYNVEIFNSLGQNLYNTSLSKGSNWVEVDVQNYQSGIYFISISADGDRKVKTIIVE